MVIGGSLVGLIRIEGIRARVQWCGAKGTGFVTYKKAYSFSDGSVSEALAVSSDCRIYNSVVNAHMIWFSDGSIHVFNGFSSDLDANSPLLLADL